MGKDYLAGIREFHRRSVLPYLGSPKGSAESDIASLERELGHSLPEAYKQYLSWMGDDYRGVFAGCDWHLRNVIPNTDRLPKLLAENHVDWSLPEHFLAFMSHQGYMAAYFVLPKEDDDPPVYFYNECGEEMSVVRAGTFTQFLLDDMIAMAEPLPELHNARSTED